MKGKSGRGVTPTFNIFSTRNGTRRRRSRVDKRRRRERMILFTFVVFIQNASVDRGWVERYVMRSSKALQLQTRLGERWGENDGARRTD